MDTNWELAGNCREQDVAKPESSGSLDKNEFFDVYRVFRPAAPREEFEREWDEFQAFKDEYLRKRSLQ